MDTFGNIDFRKPGPGKDDFRTSSYRGHIILADDVVAPPPPTLRDVCYKFPHDADRLQYQSENRAEFGWKPCDSSNTRNPTLKTILYMKRFDELSLRNAPRPLNSWNTTLNRDFEWKVKQEEESLPEKLLPVAIKPPEPKPLNRKRPGYAKLLDPSATTNNLTHVEFPNIELGIGTQDAITYWNWNKYKYNVAEVRERLCDKFRAAECPKRYKEYTSLLKRVPHYGMTSTMKTTITNPSTRLNFDISHVNNMKIADMGQDLQMTTENQMYGTGDCSQRHVL